MGVGFLVGNPREVCSGTLRTMPPVSITEGAFILSSFSSAGGPFLSLSLLALWCFLPSLFFFEDDPGFLGTVVSDLCQSFPSMSPLSLVLLQGVLLLFLSRVPPGSAPLADPLP